MGQIQTDKQYFSSKFIIQMSFWDIDDYLAEEQKIQCHFTKQASGMQFIDPTKGNGGNFDANQQIQTPIWVLNIINDYMPQLQEKGYLKVKFPGYLHSKQFQNRISSFCIDKRTSTFQKVNFFRQSPYMYETYLLLFKLMEHQKVNFDKTLMAKYLILRGKSILIRTSNYVGDKNIDLQLNTYTTLENKIYRKTKGVMQDCNAWKYAHLWLNKHNSLNKKTIK